MRCYARCARVQYGQFHAFSWSSVRHVNVNKILNTSNLSTNIGDVNTTEQAKSPAQVYSSDIAIMGHVGITQTPFVNRTRELSEIAAMNAKFVHLYRGINSGKIRNPRFFQDKFFVFAAQMYGAGKTRLGEEFINELKGVLEKKQWKVLTDLNEEVLNVMKEFADNAVPKYYHFNSVNSFSEASGIICGESLNEHRKLAIEMKKICVNENRPVFFIFDECGALSVDALRSLRQSCWNLLEIMSPDELNRCFPFFYFCGRGTAYDELDSNNSSLVGSHFLTLEPLMPDHVKDVLKRSTIKRTGEFAFKFHSDLQLTDEELNNLINAIIDWTAGAPRALLYIFSILELNRSLLVDIKTANGIENAYQQILRMIRNSDSLVKELVGISYRAKDLSKDELTAYFQFSVYATERVLFDDIINIVRIPNAHYLRSFNVFLEKDSGNGASCRIVVPRIVRSFLNDMDPINEGSLDRDRMMELIFFKIIVRSQDRNRSLHLALAPLFGLNESTKKVLEDFIPDNLIVSHWNNCGPQVKNNGKLKGPEIIKFIKKRSFDKVGTSHLSPAMLAKFLDNLPIGDSLLMKKLSASADGCADGILKLKHPVVLEIQIKNWIKSSDISDINAEIAKSVVTYDPSSGYTSVFVIVNKSGILNVPTNETLILPSGRYDEQFKLNGAGNLEVPHGMILVLPSIGRVSKFLGRYYSKVI